MRSRVRLDGAMDAGIRFTTPDFSRVKEELFAHAQLEPLLFDFKEQYFAAPKFVDQFSNTLIHFPNYHSFVIRYSGDLHPCSATIYRLWNPFQGMSNEYNVQRPACHFWACATVHMRGSAAFLMLYDLHFEKIRAQNNSNFEEIFNQRNFTVNCSAGSEVQLFDLTSLTEKHTMYPLQVLNLSRVQRVQFDSTILPYRYNKLNLNRSFSEESLDYSLRLQVFFSDGRISTDNITGRWWSSSTLPRTPQTTSGLR